MWVDGTTEKRRIHVHAIIRSSERIDMVAGATRIQLFGRKPKNIFLESGEKWAGCGWTARECERERFVGERKKGENETTTKQLRNPTRKFLFGYVIWLAFYCCIIMFSRFFSRFKEWQFKTEHLCGRRFYYRFPPTPRKGLFTAIAIFDCSKHPEHNAEKFSSSSYSTHPSSSSSTVRWMGRALKKLLCFLHLFRFSLRARAKKGGDRE